MQTSPPVATGPRSSGARHRAFPPALPDVYRPHRRLSAGWPLFAALVLFPVWWALGLGSFVFPIVAIPMAIQLSRLPVIKTPPWFWLWGMFVAWSLLAL